MSRVGLSIAGLFILALLLYVPSWMSPPPEVSQEQDIRALTPTYKAKNITTRIYDEAGHLSHQVFAKSMEHYDLLGFVLFSEPEYTLYTDDTSQPWHLHADEGTLYDNNLIHLESNVSITNEDNDNFVRSISTEFIEINLKTKIATSNEPMIIKGVNFVVTGNGFNANLETKQYELSHHVETIYTPSL